MLRTFIASATATIALFCAAARAEPVCISSQSRDVSVSANVELNGVTDSKSDARSAPDTGPFAGSASTEARVDDANGVDFIRSFATASQNSTLSDSRFEFSGTLSTGGELSSTGANTFSINNTTSTSADIAFSLSQSTTLTPAFSFSPNFTPDVNSSGVSFGVFAGSDQVADFRSPAPIDLGAGDYRLVLEMSFGASSTSDFDSKSADYSAAVDFAPTGNNAIPLPPAVWSSGATLVLAGLVRLTSFIS